MENGVVKLSPRGKFHRSISDKIGGIFHKSMQNVYKYASDS
jgi:hypothetical protein